MIRRLTTFSGLALLGAAASAQNDLHQNDIPLHNGRDFIVILNDPTVGADFDGNGINDIDEDQDGNGVPDLLDAPDPNWAALGHDFNYKIYPKELLNYFPRRDVDGDGSFLYDYDDKAVEVTGLAWSVFDTDWGVGPVDGVTPGSSPATTCTIAITRTRPCDVPGIQEPDFSQTLAVISGTSLDLPNPCNLPGNPLGCDGPDVDSDGLPDCPGSAGFVVGYAYKLSFGVDIDGDGDLDAGNGEGLVLAADGLTDYAVVQMEPGGEIYQSSPPPAGTPGNYCGNGDVSINIGMSGDEDPYDIEGLGLSPFSGYNWVSGGFASGIVFDPPEYIADITLETWEPSLVVRYGNPLIGFFDTAGLSGLRLDLLSPSLPPLLNFMVYRREASPTELAMIFISDDLWDDDANPMSVLGLNTPLLLQYTSTLQIFLGLTQLAGPHSFVPVTDFPSSIGDPWTDYVAQTTDITLGIPGSQLIGSDLHLYCQAVIIDIATGQPIITGSTNVAVMRLN